MIIRTVNFKDWHWTAWVEGGASPAFPEKCTCCGQFPDTEHVDEMEGRSIRYPICSYCRKHAKVDQIAAMISLGLALPATGAAMFFIPVFRRGLLLAGLLAFVVFLVVGGTLYWFLSSVFANKTESCPDSSWPLSLMQRPSEDGSEHTERDDDKELRLLSLTTTREHPNALELRFTNQAVFEEFLKRNGGDPNAVPRIEAAI